MRVIITHDFYETFGGAERVTAEIAATFPDAPVYALLGRRVMARRMGVEDRAHPILPERPRLLEQYRWLAPAYPLLVRAVRLPPVDLVISSSYGYAHGFRSSNDAPRLCYCHGPLRHLWSQRDVYARTVPGGLAGRWTFKAYTTAGRWIDRRIAASVDSFLTQSSFTARLIEQSYRRPAQIVPPPIDCELFQPSGSPPQGYFLFVGRLVEAYKRPSILIEAFRRMPDLTLLVAGDGPARAQLEAAAPGNVEFLGALDDNQLVRAMQGCDAALFPSVDDFGLVPLEVNACGRPVIALRAGGALHTVRPGVSGEFLDSQTPEAVLAAVRGFDPSRFDSAAVREHALRWDARGFREQIRRAAEELVRS